MNNKLSSILRDLAANFNALAEELEIQQEELETRISHVDARAYRNQSVLQEAARTILEQFNSY
jgi:CBS-domain-containing membrane protein